MNYSRDAWKSMLWGQSSMSKFPAVLVTGLGSYGEQILKALKHPEAAPWRVVGVDIDPYCVHFGLADHAAAIRRGDSPGFIEDLVRVCKRFSVVAIFPGCEPDLDKLATYRQEIEKLGIRLMIAPDSVLAICRDKVATGQRLAEIGIDSPRFAVLNGPTDLAGIDWY